MKDNILSLSKLRYEYLNDEEKYEKEIDELGNKIYDLIKLYVDELDIEFIITELTKLGHSPAILYDDNGHFAVTSNGFQSLSKNLDKEDTRDDINLSYFVSKLEWQNTIREALLIYLNS